MTYTQGVYYVSAPSMTVSVDVDRNGRIVGGPPIVRRWYGQQLSAVATRLGRNTRVLRMFA